MHTEAGPKLLREWIARAARRDPAKPWIVSVDDGRTVTYGQLQEVTGRIGTLLRDRGLAPTTAWRCSPTIRSSIFSLISA